MAPDLDQLQITNALRLPPDAQHRRGEPRLTRTGSRAEAIRSLDIADLVVDFFCFSLGASASPPSLPRSIIERAALLGIRVEMDHYETRHR